MTRSVVCVLVFAGALVAVCTTAWAQSTAQISGTVRDQSGAVLPGVEVTAIQTDTAGSRSTVTGHSGSGVSQLSVGGNVPC